MPPRLVELLALLDRERMRLKHWIEHALQQRYPELVAKWPHLYRLARMDRPIGTYLLLWPTLSALWIAAEGIPDFHLLLIFGLGTFLMRSAGCCINDFADADFDGHVSRTRHRPLAAGTLTRRDALSFFAVLSALAFVLVLFTNRQTVLLSFGALGVAALYPFTKRFTSLPQVVLGVAFSWGMLMAFTAQRGEIPQGAWLLLIANVLWTVAYDTEYAMVDREDDLKVGIRSTAILFGTADRVIIGILQGMALLALALAGRQFDLGGGFSLGLLAMAALFVHQHRLIKDREPAACFQAFLNNNWVGAAWFSGVVLAYL